MWIHVPGNIRIGLKVEPEGVNSNWRPGTSPGFLTYRADVYRRIRNFFHSKEILEVTTPLLGASSVTDLHIESVALEVSKHLHFLQTSPEFYMKRLLAAGSGPIYQICSAFRQGENGRLHNMEFSLLEWYRPGLALDQLMDEVEDLVADLFCSLPPSAPSSGSFARRTYRELFEDRFASNPHDIETGDLLNLCRTSTSVDINHVQTQVERRTRENCLDVLFTEMIQPALQLPTFVTNYPASQAALAETAVVVGDEVALRFELYWLGVELANGYAELRDAAVLEARMERDNSDRKILGFAPIPPDRKLLQAMISGLPECTGVALGLDRLLMLLTGSTSLDQVISFTTERL